jgi:hypothetical protein
MGTLHYAEIHRVQSTHVSGPYIAPADPRDGTVFLTTPSNLSLHLETLRQLNLTLRQQLEAAEARVPAINEQIAQLVGIGLIQDAALLGEVVYDKAYSPIPTPTDGSLVLQAAILIPGGLGLVAWDREEFLAVRNQGPGYRDTHLRFVPFDELGSALKALLLPQVEPLLDRLLSIVRPLHDGPRAPASGWST